MNTTNYAALQNVNTENGTQLPRTHVVNTKQYAFIMETLGINYAKDQITQIKTPYVTSGWTDNYKVMIKKPKFSSKDKYPCVEEMIAADAVSELTRAGYKVKVVGYGVVGRQEYDINTNTMTLYMEH